MAWDKGRVTVQILIVVIVVSVVAGRLLRGPMTRHVARQPPAPYVHPIVPSPPVVNPPPKNCRVPDLELATAVLGGYRAQVDLEKAHAEADVAVRRARAEGRVASAPRPPSPSCHDQPEERAKSARIDMLAQGVSKCVAQDAPLDGTWSQVQSAVMALQTCADCAGTPPARAKACARVNELLAETKKGIDQAREAYR